MKVREDLAGELQRYVWQDAQQFGQGVPGDGTDAAASDAADAGSAEQAASGAEAR